MRVVFINSLYAPFAVGGAEATLQGLAEGLADRGWDSHVICLTPRPRRHRDVIGGVNVHYEPNPSIMWPFDLGQPVWRRALFYLIEAYNPLAEARVHRALRSLRPDVVHVHNFRGFSTAIWRAASRLNIPVVQTLHDYTLVCPRGVMYKAGHNCTKQCASCRLFTTPSRFMRSIPRRYTAVSYRMLDRMADCGAFMSAAKPVVVRGDNPDVLTAADVQQPDPRRRMTFGFLGRLDPMKGLETLIEAAKSPELAQTSVVIAGTGDADYVKALKKAAASAANISFRGRMDPAAFFSEIDALVVPSIWEEPLGRVVHEAFAFGKPVLASRMGGIPEIVQDGVNGILVEASSSTALATAMRAACDNPASLARMGRAALECSPAFERSAILDQYQAILEAAIHAHQAPVRS